MQPNLQPSESRRDVNISLPRLLSQSNGSDLFPNSQRSYLDFLREKLIPSNSIPEFISIPIEHRETGLNRLIHALEVLDELVEFTRGKLEPKHFAFDGQLVSLMMESFKAMAERTSWLYAQWDAINSRYASDLVTTCSWRAISESLVAIYLGYSNTAPSARGIVVIIDGEKKILTCRHPFESMEIGQEVIVKFEHKESDQQIAKLAFRDDSRPDRDVALLELTVNGSYGIPMPGSVLVDISRYMWNAEMIADIIVPLPTAPAANSDSWIMGGFRKNVIGLKSVIADLQQERGWSGRPFFFQVDQDRFFLGGLVTEKLTETEGERVRYHANLVQINVIMASLIHSTP